MNINNRIVLWLGVFLFGTLNLTAQNPAKQTKEFYEALNSGDSVKVASFLSDDLIIEHYSSDTTIRFSKSDFLKIIPNFKKRTFQEEIEIVSEITNKKGYSFTTVEFEFYLEGKKDHCGVDHILWSFDKSVGFQITQLYSSPSICQDKSIVGLSKKLDKLMVNWHKAASTADLKGYFGFMSDDFYFLGTDPSERWSKNEFYEFCKPHFQDSTAWDFKTIERNWYLSDDHNTAWFDERLNTWMLDCRGTGILEKDDNGKWKISHYSLSVLIENEKVDGFIDLRKN